MTNTHESEYAVLSPMPVPTATRPIAPPTTPGAMVWRHGKTLIMTRNWSLPDRCIKCDQPTGRKLIKRKLYWHHPALYLTILAGLLIYIVIALIIRQKAVVHLPVCTHHRRVKFIKTLSVTGGCMLGIGLCILPAVFAHNDELAGLSIITGILVFFGSLITAALIVPYIRPRQIDGQTVRFKGCCESFLAHYPLWPGR
jgi:hypothetical protein